MSVDETPGALVTTVWAEFVARLEGRGLTAAFEALRADRQDRVRSALGAYAGAAGITMTTALAVGELTREVSRLSGSAALGVLAGEALDGQLGFAWGRAPDAVP